MKTVHHHLKQVKEPLYICEHGDFSWTSIESRLIQCVVTHRGCLFDSFAITHQIFSVLKIIPFRPIPTRRGKSKLNFYFHTSLWCLKRFYESLNGLHKTFWRTTKKCEHKNLTYFLFQYNFQKCTRCLGLLLTL